MEDPLLEPTFFLDNNPILYEQEGMPCASGLLTFTTKGTSCGLRHHHWVRGKLCELGCLPSIWYTTLTCLLINQKRIYPPTGVGQVALRLAGISAPSKHIQMAYDTLLSAIVKNDRLHDNVPTLASENGGVSGYVSQMYSPEYEVSVVASGSIQR